MVPATSEDVREDPIGAVVDGSGGAWEAGW